MTKPKIKKVAIIVEPVDVTLSFFMIKDKQPNFKKEGKMFNSSAPLLLQRSDGSVIPGVILQYEQDFTHGAKSGEKGDLLFSTYQSETITDVVGWALFPHQVKSK